MGDFFRESATSGSLLLALPVALLAGMVSFFSPCVIPLLPGYLSYATGLSGADLEAAKRGRMALGSLLFVLGFSAVFVSYGALFGFMGDWLLEYRRQISVVLGPAAGGAAYGPALTDVVILGPEGRIFVTGPDVVRSVTGEAVDMLRLGGPEPHGRRSGVVHVLTDSEREALDKARVLAHLLGTQGSLRVSDVVDRDLEALLPESRKRAYDVHPLVDGLLDEEDA